MSKLKIWPDWGGFYAYSDSDTIMNDSLFQIYGTAFSTVYEHSMYGSEDIIKPCLREQLFPTLEHIVSLMINRAKELDPDVEIIHEYKDCFDKMKTTGMDY